MSTKRVAYILSIVTVSFFLGCSKKGDSGEKVAMEEPNHHALLLERAESAEKQLAELRSTLNQAQEEKNYLESNTTETTTNMESLTTQLAEAMETLDLLVGAFKKTEAERDDALRRSMEQEKTILELSQYLQVNEKRINELESANQELQGALEELAAAVTHEEEPPPPNQEEVIE